MTLLREGEFQAGFWPSCCQEEVLVCSPDSVGRMTSLERFRPTVASVCVQRIGPGRGEGRQFLLIQREKEPGKGLWSLPGGRRETDDYISPLNPAERNRLINTALRELNEETGIEVLCVGGLTLGFVYPVDGHRVVVFDSFLCPQDEAFWTEPIRGKGIQAVDWFSESKIQGLDLTPHAREVVRFYCEYSLV